MTDYPMRVLHVLEPEPDGTIGGADTHVLTLASCQMGRDDVEPVLFINQNVDFADRVKRLGIETTGSPRLAARKTASIEALARAMRRLQPTLIHSHGYDANFILLGALLATGFHRRPAVVMTAHGWVTAYWEHRLKTAFDRACHRVADGIILCAESQRPQLGWFAKGKLVEVIENGVTADNPDGPVSEAAKLLAKLKEGGRVVIGCVGRLSREKSWSDAIEAFQRSGLAGSASLVIVGEGLERRRLEEAAAERDCAGSVHFVGFAQDIARVYRGLDILLHTSSAETSSRVTLEAMSHGIPVVATAVGGLSQIVLNGESGFLCPHGDISGLAQQLRLLSADPWLRRKMGDSARRRQREFFSLENKERHVFDFYSRTLEVRALRHRL